VSTKALPKKQTKQSNSNYEPAPVFEFVQFVSKVTAGTVLGITMLTSSLVAGGLVGLAISFRNLPDVRALKKLYTFRNNSYI